MKIGANCVIIEADRVLLGKREDFEVWCLPGGMVDAGETLPQAAIREAREETGLEVELERFVGIYTRLGGAGNDVHIATFAARVVGGKLERQLDEVLDLCWFAWEQLPEDMLWWHRQPIRDAFHGVGGSRAWSATVTPVQTTRSRQELYALRDRMGMPRQAFYKYYFESQGTEEQLEVG